MPASDISRSAIWRSIARATLFPLKRNSCLAVWLAALPLYVGSGTPARAQRLVISVYTGNGYTRPSDVRIVQPGTNSDFTIRQFKFDNFWGRESPYYGFRFGSWFGSTSDVGADIEMRHAKAFGRVGDIRQIDGTVRGKDISGLHRVDEFVRDFRLTDGINTVSSNLVFRQNFDPGRSYRGSRATGYLSAAPIYYITYIHNDINGVSHQKSGYRGVGWGYHFFVGFRYGVSDRVGVFGEIGYSSGRDKRIGIGDGGYATVDLNTFHFNGGVSYTVLH